MLYTYKKYYEISNSNYINIDDIHSFSIYDDDYNLFNISIIYKSIGKTNFIVSKEDKDNFLELMDKDITLISE